MVSSIEVTDLDLHNGNVTQARAHARARAHVRTCINSREHSNCVIYMHYEETLIQITNIMYSGQNQNLYYFFIVHIKSNFRGISVL